MTQDFLLSALMGYLLGSIPSAYLLVRWKSSKDIRDTGSGNVGALNSYLVTHSRWIGAAVLALDLLKGMVAAIAPGVLLNGGLAIAAMAGVASVVGHNFSIWLKFKGGRGLATAAGVALVLAWPIIPAWGLLWGVGFLLTRNVNVGNALATFLLIVGAAVLPSWVLERVVAGAVGGESIRLFSIVAFSIILIKHIAPVREFVRKRREVAGREPKVEEVQKENP